MGTKRRILYIQRPPGGGSAVSLFELVKNLDRNIYEPVVLFYEASHYCEQFQQLGIKVVVLRQHVPSFRAVNLTVPSHTWLKSTTLYQVARQIKQLFWQDWPLIQQVADIIREESVDLVHQNNDLRSNRTTVMAATLTKKPQVCHVRWLHDYSVQPLQFQIDRYLSHQVDYFIYISDAVEKTCRHLAIPNTKSEVVYNPFDLKKFKGNDATINETRTQLGLTAQDKVISNIGRLTPWKGQDNFLQAIAKIVLVHPNVKALLVGSPDPIIRDRDYYEYLKQLVKQLRLTNYVIFTGFRDDVAQIISASDIIVHSSTDPEPFGRIIVEAMASARPVIATSAGGVLEIIEDHVTGILVPLKDATYMAEAINELINKQQLAIDIGRQAQQFVQTRFTIEHHVNAVQQIYARVLNQR